MKKSLIRRIGFWIAYLVFLAAVVEISLQLFYRFNTGGFLTQRVALPIYVNEEYGRWGLQPNLTYRHHTPEYAIDIYTNEEGFRTTKEREEYTFEKDPNVYRVMLLGPSFAFGWGVDYEDSFAEHLKKDLQASNFANGKRIEIINHGIPGLPSANNLHWFKNVGKKYSPDLVIQFIYGSMEDRAARDTKSEVNSSGYLVSGKLTNAQRVRGYLKKSATIFYAWTVYMQIADKLWGPDKNAEVQGAGRKIQQADVFHLDSPLVKSSLPFFQDLKQTMNEANTRLLVIYFPLAPTLYVEDRERWRHLGIRDVEVQQAFDAAFIDYLNEQGIPSFNLTEGLIKAVAESDKRLYFKVDVHWTPEGNEVAAQVADHLIVNTEYQTPSEAVSANLIE